MAIVDGNAFSMARNFVGETDDSAVATLVAQIGPTKMTRAESTRCRSGGVHAGFLLAKLNPRSEFRQMIA
jgi:hypothetical protein